MRERLAEIEDVRATFRARVERFGSRTSYGHYKPMVLLADVRDSHGNLMTDHVWFDHCKWVDDLRIQPGDEIQFDARVRPYVKGYIDKHLDYKLNHPTRIKKIVNAAILQPEPLFANAGI